MLVLQRVKMQIYWDSLQMKIDMKEEKVAAEVVVEEEDKEDNSMTIEDIMTIEVEEDKERIKCNSMNLLFQHYEKKRMKLSKKNNWFD